MLPKLSNFLTAFSLGSILLASNALLPNLAGAAEIEGSLSEHELETVDSVKWAADDWEFSKLLEIKESLVNSIVGRLTIDRHGVGPDGFTGNLFCLGVFCSPLSGRAVVVSLWGSKIEGCFVEIIVQYATEQNISPGSITPTRLEIGVNGSIVALTPSAKSQPKVFQGDYSYSNTTGSFNVPWYAARQIFPVDATIAAVLSQAKEEETKARITFAETGSLREIAVFPIGKETVKRWKDAYAFNPACVAPK
jgi:hypothetical protein